MKTAEFQAGLITLGYELPRFGADGKFGEETRIAMNEFQEDSGLELSQRVNAETEGAMQRRLAVVSRPPRDDAVPTAWMPKCRIDRVIVHWTAGQHRASPSDREHYHILIEGDGSLVRGTPTLDKNDASGTKTGYAAHTLNKNTGSAGVSMCAMVGATENPFSPGSAPLTQAQWDAMTGVVADLCRRYGIPVTDRTVLTHAEVQPNLGVRQRGKWDVTRLPFSLRVVGHRAVGDLLRQQVSAHMQQ